MRHETADENIAASLPGYLALRASDFAHPREVLADQDLDPVEKRALLASWASDASAVESRPEFRWLPGTPGPVTLTQILSALRALDAQMARQSAMIAAIVQKPGGQGARS